jgi:transcriptional regulator with XRE-family HTH domain
VKPTDVGVRVSGRRRTPGLRREEVARLADVGISWYTWLEQGRSINVSQPLLERLARALRLTATEREHLFALAQGRPAPRPPASPAVVTEALQQVLHAHPFPAWVSTPRRDFLAWNRAHTVLYGDFGELPVTERNGLRLVFLNPRIRSQMPNWEAQARASVASFRVAAARAADRAPFDTLVDSLTRASPEFARIWSEHDVAEVTEGAKIVLHETAGRLEFQHVSLAHAEPDGEVVQVTLSAPRPGPNEARTRELFASLTR